MHAVLTTGELIRTGFGAACRWDLANGWDNGNDHGMYAYNEPGIPKYTPHPAFFHLYYMRRHTGDVMLRSTVTGAPGVVVNATAFSSGQIGSSLVNTSKVRKVVRLNLKDYGVGARFYTYTLTGTEGTDFFRKVLVNGTGNNLEAGGPEDYETLKAVSTVIGDDIRVVMPPLSSLFILVEPGTRQLAINNEITSAEMPLEPESLIIRPNPSEGSIIAEGLPPGLYRTVISDLGGATLKMQQWVCDGSPFPIETGLQPGIYFIAFYGDGGAVTKKLVIKKY
jgi:hypothetical protein